MMKNVQSLVRCDKVTKTFNRLAHRQCVSKMFPHDELNFQKNMADKMVDDTESKYEGSLSYSLMMKHKMLHSSSSGSFSYTPGVLRSVVKLQKLIDAEMQEIGAQKIAMPSLSPQKLWDMSGRWEVMSSELFKLHDRAGASYCLSPTHEESITSIVASESPISHKRLPIKLYQIGKKFRDEKRPKHGLLRCREFDMKDLYTFDGGLEEAYSTFNEVCTAYHNIINWLDIPHITVEASTGSMGGKKSTEFHLLSPVGEDTLYTCKKCGKSYNKELLEEQNSSAASADSKQNHCSSDQMQESSGIEVAHAFVLETRYTDKFRARYIDQAGNKRSLVMGCYGIGVGRLLAASVELLSSSNTIRFPRLLAPYQICIIPQKEGYKSHVTNQLANQLYDQLSDFANLRNEVSIDDRTNFSIGQRLQQASSIGYPFAIALGKKALDETEAIYEFKDLYNDQTHFMNLSQLLTFASTLPSIQI